MNTYTAVLPKFPGRIFNRGSQTKPVQLLYTLTHFNGHKSHLVEFDGKREWIADHQLIKPKG